MVIDYRGVYTEIENDKVKMMIIMMGGGDII